MLLSFQNISHGFDDVKLFENIGCCLIQGGMLTVKGPNGCGKTTLLKILAGLIKPKQGYIFYEDWEISENYNEFYSNLHYLGHKNAIDPDLTVLENLQFWAGLSKKDAAIDVALKFFKLKEKKDIKCKFLSAGWQRRVAMSRLMLTKSKLWILDEPFANLDEEVIDFTLKMIATFCDQGGIVIISCHQEITIPFGATLDMKDFC